MNRVCFEFVLAFAGQEESQQKVKNKLTSEVEVDNLEKFAKTSLAAEVILDGLSWVSKS